MRPGRPGSAITAHRARPVTFDTASRGFLESLANTAGDRLGTFASDLLTESCQVFGLFAEHLELFFGRERSTVL